MASTFPYKESTEDEIIPGLRRMTLKESASVEVVKIVSPSSIFVRPKDHIRDSLLYREPYQLIPISKIECGMFALAPVEERIFARCQIIRKICDSKASRVFFIDEAIIADVSDECIFQIDESQTHYPCQVMQVTLGRMVSLSPGGAWTPKQLNSFVNIISEFENFEIRACQVDLDVSPNRPSIIVNMFGFHNDFNEKVCIEELCAATMDDVMLSVYPINLLDDPGYEEDPNSAVFIEDFRKSLPSDWVHEIQQEADDNEDDWEIPNCSVIEWDLKGLESFQDENRCFMAFVEPVPAASPTEMQILPIKMEFDVYTGNEQWIFDQYDKMTDYLKSVENFYSNVKNQRPLDVEEIKECLEKGRVYAMTSIQHRKTTGPSWYRCEILDVMSTNNVAVRFLDNGRKSFEKLKNIYRMHRQHTLRRPLALEAGKVPDTETTRKEMMNHFELPYDIPLVFGPELRFSTSGKLEISQLRVYEEEENLLETSWFPMYQDSEECISTDYYE